MSNSSVNVSNASDPCEFYETPYLHERFYLVSVVGSCVALIGWIVGVLCNGLLCHLFMYRMPRALASPLLYLTVLAVLDLFVEFSYILALPVGFLAEKYAIVWLYRLWHGYIAGIFMVAQCSITATGYMIIAASVGLIEQYLNPWFKYTQRARHIAVVIPILLALLLKGTVYFEVDIEWRPECTGLASVSFTPSQLSLNELYGIIWMFWIRNVCHVLIPFFLLLLIHCSLLYRAVRLTKKGVVWGLVTLVRQASVVKVAVTKNSGKKDAMKMLIAIVISYLCMHLLNVIITTLEFFEADILSQYEVFYVFCSDVQSLLTVLCGTIRLAIYYMSNATIRKQISTDLRSLRSCHARLAATQPESLGSPVPSESSPVTQRCRPATTAGPADEAPYLTALALKNFERKSMKTSSHASLPMASAGNLCVIKTHSRSYRSHQDINRSDELTRSLIVDQNNSADDDDDQVKGRVKVLFTYPARSSTELEKS